VVLILTTLAIALLPHPHGDYGFNWLVAWAVLYALYLLALSWAAHRSPETYCSQWFRQARTQVNFLMVSIIVVLTGGLSSVFWPFYILPILGTILYSESGRQLAIASAETILLYAVSCWLVAGDDGLQDWSRLVMNSCTLLFLGV